MLNFESDKRNSNSGRLRRKFGFSGSNVPKVFLVFSFALLLFLGSTFAANINLTANGNNRIEFGQGVTRTVVCGGSNVEVLLTPYSSFINASRADGGGSFAFTGVKLEEIPDECFGASFRFRAYEESSNSPLVLSSCASDGRSIAAYFNGDSTLTGVTDISTNDFGEGVADVIDKSSNSFEVAWNGACSGSPISANNIYNITVESFKGPAPADGSGLGGFTFADCEASTLDPCALYGNALNAQISNHDFTTPFNPQENSGPELRLCPSGYAVIGIKAGANQYVGEVSPICAPYPSKSVEHQFSTWSLENPGYLVSDESFIKEQRCTGQNWVTGFGGRAGAINDAIQPICRTANGKPATATLGTLFGGMGGGAITSKRCVQGEVVNGIWVWGLYNQFNTWAGSGGGEGLAFRCTKIANL